MPVPRLVLTIAGSDPTGGAGIQGDSRALGALGVHALSAITCITTQGVRGVLRVVPLEPALVRAQIDAVLEGVDVGAIKIGALGSAGIVRVVAAAVARVAVPIVLDPVLASTRGAALLDRRGLAALVRVLMPRVTLVTPNTAELGVLLDRPAPRDVAALREATRALHAMLGIAVLGKGGHLDDAPIDVLIDADGERLYRGARVEGPAVHGTGCTLSSAIAAHLARGRSLRAAIGLAKPFVAAAIRAAIPLGTGARPLDPYAAARRPRSR